MENEKEMNETAAVNETESCCCCENGVCSFEAPAPEAKEEEKAECDCCCCENTDADAEAAAENADADVAETEKEAPAPRPVIPVTDEMLADVRGKLAMMLDYLGLEATVKAEAGTGKINLTVTSEDAGRIIGRKGQTLENFQLLLNRMMQKNDVNYPKIYIDIDGYSSGTKCGGDSSERRERGPRRERGERNGDSSERRERGPRRERRERGERTYDSHDENLRMLALDSAKEVRRWGDSKTLPEMNAHDRRIIHVTLEKETDIITGSVGEDPHKSVVISLKKGE